MEKTSAILLLGPTGAGKTPLGQLLDREGLWGRRCFHFDFGENLRRIVAAATPPELLSRDDVEFLRSVLDQGALLEDEHFPIAEKILRVFLAERGAGGDDLVVLNGLPRHVGQAENVDAIVDVVAVVELACTPEIVFQRIGADAGGDRDGRTDDDEQAIRRKLAVYSRRSAPLVDHYRRLGAAITTVDIAADTSAENVRDQLGGCDPARER